jgi:hypothetical protein
MSPYLVIPAAIAYSLIVWFDTNAVEEYAELLGITRIGHLAEYFEARDNKLDLSYREFLEEYHSDEFVVRMLSCPICLSFWVGAWFSLSSGFVFTHTLAESCCAVPALAFIGLTLYYLYRILVKYANS